MKKKFTTRIAAAVLAALMVVTCVPAATQAADMKAKTVEYVTVNVAGGQFIHRSASTSSTKVGSLLKGDWRTILDETTVGGTTWYKVHVKANVNGTFGWMEANSAWQTVSTTQPGATTSTNTSSYEIRVTAKPSLRVHKSASTNSTQIGSLKYGATAQAYSYNNQWVKIKFRKSGKTVTGYVAREFVEVIDKPDNIVSNVVWKSLNKKNAMVYIPIGNLRVHLTPSLNAKVFTTIPAGAQVKALAYNTNKTWYEVSVNGNVGYIYAADAKLVSTSGSIKMSSKSASVKAKKTKLLTVKGLSNNAKTIKITWKSNKKSVATVSKCGVVTGKKKGTAKITATVKYGNKTKKVTCTVKVK